MQFSVAWCPIFVLGVVYSTPSFSNALAKTLSLALASLTEDGGVNEDNNTTLNYIPNDISLREGDDIAHEHQSIDEQSDNEPLPLHDDDDFENYIRGSTMNASVVTRLKRRLKTVTKKEKLKFLDRIALVSAAMLKSEHDAALIETYEDGTLTNGTTPQSDFNLPGRHFSIVTTASLPWMTGTAVNPLLRAAYLLRRLKEINRNNTDIKQRQWVTLVIPWLELEDDRVELYGPNHGFSNPHDQELYIRKWLVESANLEEEADPNTGLKIIFYNARYHSGLKSIFAMGDICQLIPDAESDVCILEEPEHLNWYRAPGEGWTKKFNYVVGIVHTNYKEYASAHYSGLWTSPAIAAMSSAMVRAYCHKVVKLSDVLQTFAPEKEFTSNVHGVRSEFLEEGKRRGRDTKNVTAQNNYSGKQNTQIYFIGKILWAKGLDILLDLQKYYKQCTGEFFAVDVYGSGPELQEITRAFHGRREYQTKQQKKKITTRSKKTNSEDKEELQLENSGSEQVKLNSLDRQTFEYLHSKAVEKVKKLKDLDFEIIKDKLDIDKIKDKLDFEKIKDNLDFDVPKSLHEYRKKPIPATFPGRVDHALLKQQHKIFVNPSITEVLCTTTAEALAMGKFVIIPKHHSNTFFTKFPNCLAYRNKFEFVANVRWALSHEPEPLTPELAFEFTWEAATERLVNATSISWREARERERLGRSKLDERIAWLHYELGKGAKGDALRKVLGGGPASEQFKYQNERDSQRSDLYPLKRTDDDGEDGDEDQSDDEEEGLPRKFRMSSLAKAIRSTATNGLPMLSGFE